MAIFSEGFFNNKLIALVTVYSVSCSNAKSNYKISNYFV